MITPPPQSHSSVACSAEVMPADADEIPFVLKPPVNYNVPTEQLVEDLRAVAKKLGARRLPKWLYRKHSRFAPVTVASRFGSWDAAVKSIGLQPGRQSRISPELIIADVQDVARQLNVPRVTINQHISHGKFSVPIVYRQFDNWKQVNTSAGLLPAPRRSKTTDLEMFRNLERLWRATGRQPRPCEMWDPPSDVRPYVYRRRFGSFHNGLKAFVEWMTANQPGDRPAQPVAVPVTEPFVQHRTPRSISGRLRFRTLRRDHFRCRGCGASPAIDPSVQLHVDHIIPWSQGGETTAENLQTLCKTCNSGKSDQAWEE